MLAIKNLEDYRNFVDYSDITDRKASIIKSFLNNERKSIFLLKTEP